MLGQSVSVSIYALSQNCEKRVLALTCPSFRPFAWKNSAPTRRILIKFNILAFLKNVSKNPIKITGTLHEDVFTFMTVSR